MGNPFSIIKNLAKKHLLIRRGVRSYRLRRNHPDWNPLITSYKTEWTQAKHKASSGTKILLATSVGAHLAGTTMESLLAIALTLRGSDVHILLCDELLPACLACWVGWHKNSTQFAKKGPKPDLCKDCYSPAYKMFNSLGIGVHRYSDFISTGDIAEAENIAGSLPFNDIPDFLIDGIKLGEHALAGALRYYARGDLDGEPDAGLILKRYLKAALITTRVMMNLTKKYKYTSVVFHHGIYVPQGLIGEVCRKQNIAVVNWTPGYKKQSFIFSHHDTYHHTMIDEPLEDWNKLEWNQEMDKILSSYLESRRQGTNDWIWFHEKPVFDFNQFALQNKIDITKPCIGMLSSVMWDARLHYRSNAFKNMIEWSIATIDYFANRPELQLIIRIHPAEIRGTLPSRQKLFDEIKKLRPSMPPNIIIIPPQDNISTYAVMEKCNAVIIYNTKTGIELSAIGIPVIVAGEAWIKNKGFSIDVHSKEKYAEILDRLPFKDKLSSDKLILAKKYAYHFFFRRMIPLNFTRSTGGDPPFSISIDTLDDLLPGKDKGLDIICDGIFHKKNFIYPAETLCRTALNRPENSLSGEKR